MSMPWKPQSWNPQSWNPQATADGSFTFFSDTFGEAFHSSKGARAEAFEKYVAATDLVRRAKGDRLCLLDVCYGLGYNTAAALETIWQHNPACQVEVYGLELDLTVPQAAAQPSILQGWSEPVQTVLRTLAQTQTYRSSNLVAHLLIGDARQTIQSLAALPVLADAILFDPFSPRRCPQLWTVEFFQKVAGCLAPGGTLATYSRAASVRTALLQAGLSVGSIPLTPGEALPHEWSQGTVAGFPGTALPPLTLMEQEHLYTRAAIPYRDPTLGDLPEQILERHAQEQSTTALESTSSWRRRWQLH